MRHEKIFKRPGGNSYLITARLFEDRNTVEYSFDVRWRAPNKRKWRNVFDVNDYRYRAADTQTRSKMVNDSYMQFVTAEEAQQTLLELWEKTKPELKAW